MSPVRATARGDERTSLDGTRADVLVCGASFGGLAVARTLAGRGHDVLVLDRYEIGERATSACAIPTPWLEALGLTAAGRSELPHMTFTTPHGTARYRLPWSWTAFDYRALCQGLWSQCGAARFATAKVEGRTAVPAGAPSSDLAVRTDRGTVHAGLVVDALGWRRVLGDPGYQPPEAPLSRGLEVHPHVDAATADDALDCWVDRSVIRRGYGWRVPAGGEARIGVGSYAPADHVRRPTVQLAERLEEDAVRYQGNWFPHRLRDATQDGVFFVGDSAGHCFPLSGEGIRTALYFGIACGNELAAVLEGRSSRGQALAAYRAFSAGHGRAFARALRLQRLIPGLPPRLLTLLLAVVGRRAILDRTFGWYLDQARPDTVLEAARGRPSSPVPASMP